VKERVFVGIPTHGRVIEAGLLTASHNFGDVQATIQWSCSSLLAANFNRLLCAAKNGGHPWLLIWHGDIIPHGDSWLEGMIATARARNSDVLSTVVPIKGPHGVTSTAAVTADGIRRVTMRELDKLPEVFDASDIARALWPATALLLNTGLMLLRMDRIDPVALSFTISDRIARNADGVHGFGVLPEDWGFSCAAWGAGLRLIATQRPVVSHVGPAEFVSSARWGDETDVPFMADGRVTGKVVA
jgi:hypothetical protein